MINFEEELKKFHPSPEVEEITETIYNQDMTDLADLLVKTLVLLIPCWKCLAAASMWLMKSHMHPERLQQVHI